MPTYQVDGQPDDWNGPDFLKVGSAYKRYLPGLVHEFMNEFGKIPKVSCIIAPDGTLVPFGIFNQLPRQRHQFKAKMVRDPVGISALVDSFCRRIGEEISPVHPNYVAQARKAIAELVPPAKVVLTVEQAAAAIGVSLEQRLGPLATSPQP